MPDPQMVLYERVGRVAHIRLNRPDKLNALSPAMFEGLDRCRAAFEADSEARVAILSGNGRAFCVGFDLSSGSDGFRPADISVWQDRERLRNWTTSLAAIWNCPKPIVAQVHGFCMAGGVLLPMMCDIAIIAEECRLGWPKLPMGGGFVAPMFARMVGPARAKMMEYIPGSEISGRKAADWGYAAESVPESELADYCANLAARIARLPSELLHLKKASINRVADAAGFHETLVAGADWDALAHVDTGVGEVRTWVRDHGMKEAITRFQRDGL